MEIRLDKYLTLCDLGTRSQVQKRIRAGQIKVNGFIKKDAALSVDPATSFVECNGEGLFFRRFSYIMLNKPPGYLSATTDDFKPTVMDLLPGWCMRRKMVPVGRLDINTTGLIFITDDGGFNHDMTSPRRHVNKIYHAIIDKGVTQEDIKAFASGMRFKDFTAEIAGLRAIPCHDKGKFGAEVILKEGKYHQVKRMFATCGKKVLSLHRVAIGPIELSANLGSGYWRELTLEEMRDLYIKNPFI